MPFLGRGSHHPSAKPKRRVTKVIERYANVYREGVYFYETFNEAKLDTSDNPIVVGVKVTGSYEVEE